MSREIARAQKHLLSVATFTSPHTHKQRLSCLPLRCLSLSLFSLLFYLFNTIHISVLLVRSAANAAAVGFDAGFTHRFHRFTVLNCFFGKMSACGYNDPEMMRAAIELAQSFSRSKGNGKKKPGGDSLGGRKEHYEPHQPRQQSRYGQVAAPPRQTFPPSVPSSRPSAPPPSRRTYGVSGDFATRRGASRPVIGNLGKDFLTSGSKAEPPSKLAALASRRRLFNMCKQVKADFTLEVEKASTISVPFAGQESQKGPPADKDSIEGTTKPEPFSTPPRSSGNSQSGNILDAFYAILDNKPSIGQEIDALANMLSKAMDLNVPGTPTLDTPPIKEIGKPRSRQCACQELDGHGKTLAHIHF